MTRMPPSARTLSIYLLGALGCTASIAYFATRASAEGIPSNPPMTYAGILEENGSPVTGEVNVTLNLWRHPTSSFLEDLTCSTQQDNVKVDQGHFRLALSQACVAAIQATPDLWLEVVVNTKFVGRTKLGAVPFAVQAFRSSDIEQPARDSLVPPGTVVAFAGEVAPNGWLFCDGSPLPRNGQFERLFQAIGISHGAGDGETTFNLPDYRGIFLRGVDHQRGLDPEATARISLADGGNVGDAVGTYQGNATSMPLKKFTAEKESAHTHKGTTGAGSAHSHGLTWTKDSQGTYNSNGRHAHTVAQGTTAIRWGDDGGYTTNYIDAAGGKAGGTGAAVTALNTNSGHSHSVTVNSESKHTHPFTSGAGVAHTHNLLGGDIETRPVNVSVNYMIKY